MTESLRLHRTLAAPAERVWRAFTEPTAVAAWFWPPRTGITADIDLRVGGRYRLTATNAGFAVTGEYLVIEPTTLLVFTWQWDGEPDTTRVTLELTPAGESTELTLLHEQFATAEERDKHSEGWGDCLDRLPGYLVDHS